MHLPEDRHRREFQVLPDVLGNDVGTLTNGVVSLDASLMARMHAESADMYGDAAITRRLKIWEWPFIAAMMGGMAVVRLPGISRYEVGPHDIPRTAPEEGLRLRHPDGFSIVQQPNWDFAIFDSPDKGGGSIRLHPKSNLGRRDTAVIHVLSGTGEPKPGELQEVTFLGQPAFEDPMHIEREETFDDPANSRYSIRFERGGVWSSIDYLVVEEMTELPPMIRKYVESFRAITYCSTESASPP